MSATEVLLYIFDCKGEEITVSTTRQKGESKADWYARHDAAVASAKEACEKS